MPQRIVINKNHYSQDGSTQNPSNCQSPRLFYLGSCRRQNPYGKNILNAAYSTPLLIRSNKDILYVEVNLCINPRSCRVYPKTNRLNARISGIIHV